MYNYWFCLYCQFQLLLSHLDRKLVWLNLLWWRRRWRGCSRGRCSFFCGLWLGCRGCGTCSSDLDLDQFHSGIDGRAVFHQKLLDHSGDWRRNRNGSLVGLDLADHLENKNNFQLLIRKRISNKLVDDFKIGLFEFRK